MLDPILDVTESGILVTQVIRQGGGLEIRGPRVGRHVAVPHVQVGQTSPCVNGATDDHGCEDKSCGPKGPDEPACQHPCGPVVIRQHFTAIC